MSELTSSMARVLVDALPDPVVLLDRAGTILTLNASWRQLAKDAVHKDFLGEFNEGSSWQPQFVKMVQAGAEDEEKLSDGVRAIVAAECVRCDFVYFYSQGGEDRCLSLTLSQLVIDGSLGVLVQARRTSEPLLRRQAETELRESRERFDRMMAATREAVFLAEDGRVVDANPAALEMFGYTREGMLEKGAIELVAPESLPMVMQRIRAQMGGLYEAQLIRSDGSRFTGELIGRPVPYQGRTLRGTAVRDVTDRVRADAALRESEERFRLLAELTSEPLVLMDQGIIFDTNQALADLLGIAKEELIGRPVMELIESTSRQRVRDAVASEQEDAYEATALYRDGSPIPVLVRGRSLPFRGRTLRGTTLHDLRLQRQAEEALRQSVVQEEKLAAQAAILVEQSTPIIPISERIMVMPLIGSIDARRAENIMKTLLEGIRRSGASIAILDVTGVPKVEEDTADGLVRVARAAGLIGAQVILTGIRAEVARTLVETGADLSGITMRGTLQSGIAYAMGR